MYIGQTGGGSIVTRKKFVTVPTIRPNFLKCFLHNMIINRKNTYNRYLVPFRQRLSNPLYH